MRRIWLNKRLYEGLPVAYMAVGVGLLIASLYLAHGGWSVVLAVFGLSWVTGGLVVLLKRRDYRASRSRAEFDEQL